MPVREIIVICLVVIMASIIGIQWEWLAVEKLQNRGLESQIEYLQTQAEAESERYEYAQQQADVQLKQMQKQVTQVIAAHVPKKCNDAMKWAINEAKAFREVEL